MTAGAGHEIGLGSRRDKACRAGNISPSARPPDLALDVLDKHKGAGAEDMRLRELRVLGELGGAVDAVPRRGEIRQHRRIRPLQVKDDGQRVGRVDRRDRAEIDLARRDHALAADGRCAR